MAQFVNVDKIRNKYEGSHWLLFCAKHKHERDCRLFIESVVNDCPKNNSNKIAFVHFVCKIRNHFNRVELINAFQADSDSLTNKIIKNNCLSLGFLY